jgi:alpha-amylase/alpha-mannosidase (GH57 family)
MSFIADSTPESEIRNSIDAVVSVGENREEDSPVGPYEFWVRLYGSVIIWIGESTSDHLSTWYTAVKEHIEENRENAGTIRTDIEARVGSSDVVMDEFRAVW